MGRKKPKTETEIRRDQIKAAYKAALAKPARHPENRQRTESRYKHLLQSWAEES